MQINISTKITGDVDSVPIQKAVKAFERDLKNTCEKNSESGLEIRLIRTKKTAENETNTMTSPVIQKSISYDASKERFIVDRKDHELTITSESDFGLIYGIYHISREFLGVQNFWFWNEQELYKQPEHVVPDNYHYESKPSKVRFRGWFINDEVLFDGWREKVGENFPWEMAFEALLRCGGNMTIPGTDHNSHRYKKLADEYGLWITHHHAEPLGAQMFARAYPDLEASFNKHPDLFRGLWQQAIEDQKNCKVVWNLGFRGQGDRPFWADDPTYDTPEARGKLMSELILEQYNLVKESDKDAVCCTNLYGETMELYQDGYLTFPSDVIKIWADNGFGKMVSRRQNNHNPRVYALPHEGDNSAHGIYYHASFYDLQAAAMMTMLPNAPEFVVKELTDVYAHGADDFWIINCSNIKPHTYYLDLIAKMWSACDESNSDCNSRESLNAQEYGIEHLHDYVRKYYGSITTPDFISRIEDAYKAWPDYTPKYGPNDDDHAGEQFSNHGSRILACGFISNFDKFEPSKTGALPELNWICAKDTLLEQTKWHEEKYKEALEGYTKYLEECNNIKEELMAKGENKAAEVLDNNLICQVQYHYYSYLGAYHICRAIITCLDDRTEGGKFIDVLEEGSNGKQVDFLTAFYEAGLAKKAFFEGYNVMRSHEHDIWEGFYENDCEADIRQSGFVAASLMSYLRTLGDGPHFYKWQRKFQKESGGEKVHLILRIKAHLDDDELWNLMTQ